MMVVVCVCVCVVHKFVFVGGWRRVCMYLPVCVCVSVCVYNAFESLCFFQF